MREPIWFGIERAAGEREDHDFLFEVRGVMLGEWLFCRMWVLDSIMKLRWEIRDKGGLRPGRRKGRGHCGVYNVLVKRL